MLNRDRPRRVSPAILELYANLIEEACGVRYGADDRGILAEKLDALEADLDHERLLDYYYRLRYDDPDGVETEKLVSAVLVHETYFFRELAALVQLVDGHLSDVIRARGRARVWSAACSSGEEPLTLAMLLDDRGLLDQVEIIATDISEAAIARATEGIHHRRALREGHPARLAGRYLEVDGQRITVVPRIRSAVRFRTGNLLDAEGIGSLGVFDAILCRNVLIYFRENTIATVVDSLVGSLGPAGVLAVGASESLLRMGAAVACEERGGAFFYRSIR